MDVLRRFVVELDPAAGVVRLSDPRSSPVQSGDGTLQLRREARLGRRRQLPLILDGAPLWLVLDTGADRTWVRGTAANLLPTAVQEGVRVRGTGISGGATRTLVFYTVQKLEIGDLALADQEVVGRTRPWWSQGLLGLDVLAHLHGWYDFRHGRARLEPALPAELPDYQDWTGTAVVTVGPRSR